MVLDKSFVGTILFAILGAFTGFGVALFATGGSLIAVIALYLIAVVASYFILRVLLKVDDKVQPQAVRQSRAERWLNTLDDAELDALRDRLTDRTREQQYESIGDLMEQQKRKRN